MEYYKELIYHRVRGITTRRDGCDHYNYVELWHKRRDGIYESHGCDASIYVGIFEIIFGFSPKKGASGIVKSPQHKQKDCSQQISFT